MYIKKYWGNFTKSGLVLHTDYGAMSIYSCAL